MKRPSNSLDSFESVLMCKHAREAVDKWALGVHTCLFEEDGEVISLNQAYPALDAFLSHDGKEIALTCSYCSRLRKQKQDVLFYKIDPAKLTRFDIEQLLIH